ncbi:MAG: DNA mismatch repair endonuclease MutL [Desulfomonilia bacterium]|nr:DNA mismatch repair endonuclease MutL [Desulfomonilia bacterium]
MAIIQVLTQELINQIAAGEVIERPASVVKELVENSLDAEASSISLEVSGAGTDVIRIVDNGSGMDEHELFLAIKRHATSKITCFDDLHAIRTLGFRGEALPSILSVSRSTVSSRKASTSQGYYIQIDAGTVIDHGIRGMPEGTIVEVRDLFFNTPARKKFLKTSATEQRAIIDVVSRAAISFWAVRFTLIMNGRTVMNLPETDSLKDRAWSVLGRQLKNQYREFFQERPGITIHGMVGLPAEARPTRAGIYTYVNSRPVKDYILTSAIIDGYKGMLMKNKYPVAVLFVEIDPSDIDVNVHPTKAEVRFKHPSAVFGIIASTVSQAVSPQKQDLYQEERSRGEDPFQVREDRDSQYEPHVSTPSQEGLPFSDAGAADIEEAFYTAKKIIGTLFSTYILLQDADFLYILDQHAAHERIMYEKLKVHNTDAETRSQMLLNPILLDLSTPEYAAFEEITEPLQALGIECSPFGDRTIAIRSVPPLLTDADIQSILLDLLHSVISGSLNSTDHFDGMIARIACHRSITSGSRLADEEIRALLGDLDRAENSQTCPHGRPLFKKIGKAEIERWIGRRP